MSQDKTLEKINGSQVLGEAAKQRITQMFRDFTVTMADGRTAALKGDNISSIDPFTGEYLAELIRENQFTQTLETGLAYGCSAIYILSAVEKNSGSSLHVAIDPYQFTDPEGKGYNGIGIDAIETLGWGSSVKFIQDRSLPALSRLLENGNKIDFMFIDGDHRFDGAFIDFILGDKILDVGGIIVLDDLWMPSIQKLCGFIENNMQYKRLDQRHHRRPIWRRLGNSATPARVAAFRKQADDHREWTHFVDF